jgi:hypothetical protein
VLSIYGMYIRTSTDVDQVDVFCTIARSHSGGVAMVDVLDYHSAVSALLSYSTG